MLILGGRGRSEKGGRTKKGATPSDPFPVRLTALTRAELPAIVANNETALLTPTHDQFFILILN